MKKKLLALALVPLFAMSLSACSGGSGGVPSKADVTKGIQKSFHNAMDAELGELSSDIEKEMARTLMDKMDEALACGVDKSYDSLSEETLTVLAEPTDADSFQDKMDGLPKADQDVLEENMSKCARENGLSDLF